MTESLAAAGWPTPAARTERFEALEFDLAGPLPTGISVLEASAGTGKTYTIAALAARYVAEGTPLDRLLLVTFTRMATGELRERVRDRLVRVHNGLEHVLVGLAPPQPDPIVELFAREPPELLRPRRDRLARAIADFDAATIATTHAFCQEVLVGLGIAADLEPDITFVEDLRELTQDVIDDLYVRRFHRDAGVTLPFAQAANIARVAIDNPAAKIVTAPGEAPQMRGRLAAAARTELDRRKHRMSVMTYDDLLTRLRAALDGPDGPTTAARLRARYQVVLVDEFQDTDPVQWDIMRLAFGAPDRALILIADPKQAIYAFRGADVYSYLEAAREAGSRATLRVNWRSDQGLIDAYDALFAGAKLGHEGIAYRRVKAAPANREPRLLGAPDGTALRIRIVDRAAVDQTPRGYAKNRSARAHIARDVAAEIVELLSSGAELETRSDLGTPIRRERVRPGHIAVLVPTNRSAAQIRQALDAAGVPAVINGAGSVFGTEPAREWLRLLEAIERPASSTRAHSAALTCFIGWSAETVAAADELAWEHVHGRLHDWARVMRSGGVASLIELITALEGLPGRVLAAVDGERRLTDLRHVGQLLHAQAARDQLGTTALAGWLRRRIAEAKSDTGDEERSRRLESDAEAVQVLTVHRSKGLEFPIVYLPFLWEPGHIPKGENPVFFHDPDADDQRTIDVALEGDEYARHKTQYELEQRGEDLRLAYVALTRARHQAVVWWAGSYDSRFSALGRLLFAREEDGTIAAAGRFTPDDAAVYARLRGLAEGAPGCVAVQAATLGAPSAWRDELAAPGSLCAATFDRGLDLCWRRTSYTDITSGSHDPRVSSEPEEPLIADETAFGPGENWTFGPGENGTFGPGENGTFGPGENSLARILGTGPRPPCDPLAAISPLAEMPFGVQIGTFIHGVFEATDFAAPDIDGELRRQIAAAQGGRATEIGDPEIVRVGLRAALETPLGPILGGASLRDVARADRLDELGFELPLAGGDRPGGWLTLSRIGQVLREHLDIGDPLAGYAERLQDPALRQRVRGFLTGSLDLVVRMAGPDGPRFAVCDFKTNWLGLADEPLTVWHHRPAALAAEMQRRHYALQALLYAVALHRYLRWRLPEYDPERHIAGVLYLFVRGMVGAGAPILDGAPCGVFAWRPPAGLVPALSDALDEGTP